MSLTRKAFKRLHYPIDVIAQCVRWYLAYLIEQDHRNIKRRIRPMLGFKSFRRAQTLLAGIELIQMIRKGQLHHPAGDGLSPAEQFYLLAA
ncbi:DDE-type integrase/transposase/recombinase [Photorhabdus tasmaniensis]